MKDPKKTQASIPELQQNDMGKLCTGTISIILGLSLLLLSMTLSIAQGAVQLPLKEVWDAILHFDKENSDHLIVIDLRLPRTAASALVGAAFAVSGAIMQGVTRNPMADSGLLGINAGAAFALSICFALAPGSGYMKMILFSFLGAAFSTVIVNGISVLRGGGTPMRLVLAGVAVSSLLTAFSQGIALYFDVAQSIMFWTAGGMSGSNWNQVKVLTPWIVCALSGAILLSPSITLLSLGEDVAKGLGVNTSLIKLLCSLLVLILAGASVSVVGAVSFVGLIIPHLARSLAGIDYRIIIPFSAVLGAILMVLADLGSRILNPPFETPVGVLTALIGVPSFLYLARKQRRSL